MSTPVTLLQEYGTYEEENLGHVIGLNANTTNVATCIIITKKWNQIDTSVPPLGPLNAACKINGNNAVVGMEQNIYNNSAHSVDVYNSSGTAIIATIAPQQVVKIQSAANNKYALISLSTVVNG